MSKRARAAQGLAEDIAFAQAPARLAKALLHLSEPIGAGAGRARVNLRLSQRALASMAATSRETMNRLLRRWQDDGLIIVADDGITLNDTRLLRVFAG